MDSCKSDKLRVVTLSGYMLIILMSSLMPMDQKSLAIPIITRIRPELQNLLHIPAFAVLAVLWLDFLKTHQRKILIVVVVSISFGTFNELIQFVVPGRYPSAIDAGFNTIGVFGGIIFFPPLSRLRLRLSKRIVR